MTISPPSSRARVRACEDLPEAVGPQRQRAVGEDFNFEEEVWCVRGRAGLKKNPREPEPTGMGKYLNGPYSSSELAGPLDLAQFTIMLRPMKGWSCRTSTARLASSIEPISMNP